MKIALFIEESQIETVLAKFNELIPNFKGDSQYNFHVFDSRNQEISDPKIQLLASPSYSFLKELKKQPGVEQIRVLSDSGDSFKVQEYPIREEPLRVRHDF